MKLLRYDQKLGLNSRPFDHFLEAQDTSFWGLF